MTKYEVHVETVEQGYYIIEAKNETEAKERIARLDARTEDIEFEYEYVSCDQCIIETKLVSE